MQPPLRSDTPFDRVPISYRYGSTIPQLYVLYCLENPKQKFSLKLINFCDPVEIYLVFYLVCLLEFGYRNLTNFL